MIHNYGSGGAGYQASWQIPTNLFALLSLIFDFREWLNLLTMVFIGFDFEAVHHIRRAHFYGIAKHFDFVASKQGDFDKRPLDYTEGLVFILLIKRPPAYWRTSDI